MHGKSVGPLLVESTLGTGGMGTVYGARLTKAAFGLPADAEVAVKVIHPHLIGSGDYFERFRREARIGTGIRHENVVEVYGADSAVVDEREVHYLVMALIAGRTLRALLGELGCVPEALLREIGRQVAAGLASIHAAGIVHRDLKPENVILTEDDQIRIMDLGMARLVDNSVDLTIEGHFAGTLAYAAPEQFDDRPVGPAADVYSLGVLLYELATGTNPFRRGAPPAVMLAHLQEVPVPPREWNPQVSAFFSALVLALLEKDEADRPGSAAELVRILEEGERSHWWAHREGEHLRDRTEPPAIDVHREVPVLGREEELAVLERAFDRAASGEGSAVLVEGETGIGKTRLVDEFLRARPGDAAVLYGAFLPLGGRGAIAEAILTHLGEADLEAALRPHLPATPDLVPAFAAQVRAEGVRVGTSALAAGAAEALACQLLLSLATDRTVVWVVDDLHFAEPSGRRMFLAMARAAAGHRVLLVATAEAGIPEAELTLFTGLPHARRLKLKRLGARDVVELIRRSFKSDALTDRLGARIAYKSDGVPLFVFEIIRGLRERGLIEAAPDGSFVETEVIDEIEVPDAVRDLIRARLGELGDGDRGLLEVAAVVGHRFDADLVARVREQKRVHVLERLAAMERRWGIVKSRAGESAFDHHEIRELLYEDLIPDLRAEYHTLLAEAYSERMKSGDREPAGEDAHFLARHHLCGVRREAALPHLEPALEFLAASYRNEAVLDLARSALSAEGLLTGEARERVLHLLATSLDVLGRRDEERAVLEQVVALADEDDDAERRVRARRRMGWNLLCVSRPEDARTWLADAATLAFRSGDRVGYGLSTLTLGNVYWSLGQYDESEAHYERALTISLETGDRRMEARARGNLANLARLRGRFERARAHLEGAAAIFAEIGDRTNQGAAEGNLGNVMADLGRLSDAGRHLLRAVGIARAIGDRTHQGIALLNHGANLLTLGDPEGARSALLKARRLISEVGARLYEGYVLHHQAEVAEASGDDEAARGLYGEALSIFRGVPHPSGTAMALLGLGELERRAGRPEDARGRLTKAAELARELGEPPLIVLSLGRLATMEGEDAAAAERALEEFEPRLGVVARMKARYLLGRATDNMEHLEEARRLLRHLADHAPEESRRSLLEDVPLHREIAS